MVVVVFFQDVWKNEAVPVARDRTNEARLARVVAERSADRANGLAQRAVGDDHVVPHTVEDVPAMHRLMPALDEKDEQIEIAGDEGPLAPALDEHPAPRRKDEIAEAIARHSLRDRSHVIVTDEMAVPLTSPAFAALRVRGPQAVEQFQHNAPMDFSLGTPRPIALDTISGRTS